MFYAILSIHIVLCLALIFLVLLQQGKGADMGAAFGGGANTVFGAGGATAMITKITTTLAVTFFFTSILLVKQYNQRLPENLITSDPLSNSLIPEEKMPIAESEPALEPPPAGKPLTSEVDKQVPLARNEQPTQKEQPIQNAPIKTVVPQEAEPATQANQGAAK